MAQDGRIAPVLMTYPSSTGPKAQVRTRTPRARVEAPSKEHLPKKKQPLKERPSKIRRDHTLDATCQACAGPPR